jgi:ABC-type branched-subunit amino acid transport system substrate-binding protein
VPILSTSQLGSGDAKTAAGTALIGAYYTAPKFNFSKEEDTVNFRNRYQQMYREPANFISAYAYDLGRFIAEVFKGTQHQEDGRMILQAAKQVKEFKGVTGEARIFANGEISTELVIVKALEGGGEDKEYETPK